MTQSKRPLVVVVGAGPVGLALAIELGSRSVPCLLIERQERAGHAPRAKTTHTRTREHLRRWGIADKLAAASPFGIDYPSNVTFVTRLSGYRIARFENALNCSPQRDHRYSEHSQWIPQYKLEAVLREHVQTLPSVRLEFGQEFLSFTQDSEGVRVRLRDVGAGAERIVEADFLVGADGARSVIRDQIGATMVGVYGLSRNYNTIFRAPGLAQAHKHGPAVMYWQLNADVPSLIGPMDEGDLWFFMPTMVPKGVSYTREQTLELIKTSTGIDLPYEILSSDEWVASRLLADRYSQGRVFLAGDACHLHPPFGGYGMNMGVADAVDLGWKMAAVLQGWGGGGLLQSYETERRPAHEFVMDEAEANHAMAPNQLFKPGMEAATLEAKNIRRQVKRQVLKSKRNEFHSLGVVLGYCYQNSPIVAGGSEQTSWTFVREYEPSAEPGCLAPHRWLEDGRSLYDLFGTGFTLLVLEPGHEADMECAQNEAKGANVPLKLVTLSEPALAALYGASMALIRPDQIVAWRGDTWSDAGILSIATGRSERGAKRRARVA